MVTVPTVRSGLQRQAIMEFVEDGKSPLTNLFLKVLAKHMSSGPSQGGYVLNPLQLSYPFKLLNPFLCIKPREVRHSQLSQRAVF